MNLIRILFMLSSSSIFAKTAIIITGPESSGSTFIGKHIAKVLDYTYSSVLLENSALLQTDQNLVVHFSQPAGVDFIPLARIQDIYKDYDRKFIITTRDQSITILSKRHKWRRELKVGLSHRYTSQRILQEILREEECFIWNYETMLYLEDVYFEKLYSFLGLNPNEVEVIPSYFDGNRKYIKGIR